MTAQRSFLLVDDGGGWLMSCTHEFGSATRKQICTVKVPPSPQLVEGSVADPPYMTGRHSSDSTRPLCCPQISRGAVHCWSQTKVRKKKKLRCSEASDDATVFVLGDKGFQQSHSGLDMLVFTVHGVHWGLVFFLHFPSGLLLEVLFKLPKQSS